MRIKRSPKVIAGAAIVGLVAAGGAFAFWSGDGSGAGTAMTDTTQPLVLRQDAPLKAVFPGSSIDIKGYAHNPNPGMVKISGVTGIVTVTPLTGKACLASYYTFTGGWLEGDVEPTRDAVWTGTLAMADSTANQDGCKGATLDIAYTAVPRS